ncbi:hypothetical protein, partial [Escherichia coli]|uniref:hypothetical protein n=1 Tax=Escherichia coli TaxID=562 RepID=UPI00183AE639
GQMSLSVPPPPPTDSPPPHAKPARASRHIDDDDDLGAVGGSSAPAQVPPSTQARGKPHPGTEPPSSDVARMNVLQHDTTIELLTVMES